MKSSITTHVLDTTQGLPAEGIPVLLEFNSGLNEWIEIGSGSTNSDGRISDLLSEAYIHETGIYRMTFDISKYFQKSFYPYIQIVFEISDKENHYHVPLLLNP